jgi:hypothetical protein
MSIIQWATYNGKVVSNIFLSHSPPGGKEEHEVCIKFNDGTKIKLKSGSIITIEESFIS